MSDTSIHWNSNLYADKHAFVYKYGEDLLELLSPGRGEKILDLGCGNGHLTAKIAASGADVTGIDSSIDMIASSKVSFPEIDFRVMDALSFSFPFKFDAVFSNAVMHWVPRPEAAAARIFESLRPGGRFIAEFGGKGNNERLLTALRGAFLHYGLKAHAEIRFWYFPSVAAYATVLENAGFTVYVAHLFDRATALIDPASGIKDWFKMFGERFFVGLDHELIEKILTKTQDDLRYSNFKDGIWYADYVRLRILAVK